MMKTCIIYLRISREKHGEKELSITSQRQRCEIKAKELGAEVVKVFCDRDKSGRTNKRPDFQKAMSYCESSKIDYFIVWSTSRFSRNILNAKTDKLRLRSVNTLVKYVTQDFEEGTSSGFLSENINLVLDEYQSIQTGADTLRSMIKNAQDGYFNGGRVSFGFMVIQDVHDEKKKRLMPHPDEVIIVKKVFDLRSSGMGCKSIADLLNNEAILCRLKRWTNSTIASLLRNEKMIGVSIFGKRNHEGTPQPKDKWTVVKSHDGIVSIKQWDKVQSLMDKSTNPQIYGSPKSTWLFTGLIKCESCNKNMVIKSGKGRNKRYYYYVCPNSKNGNDCTCRNLPADRLDGWLSWEINNKIFSRNNIELLTNELNNSTKTWAAEKRKMLGQQKRNLKSLYEKNEQLYQHLEDPESAINPKDIAPRLRSNNRIIEKLETQINQVENSYQPKYSDIKAEELSEFIKQELMNGAPPNAIRNFMQSFIKNMTFTNNRVHIDYEPESLLRSNNVLVPSRSVWCPERALEGTKKLDLILPENILPIAA